MRKLPGSQFFGACVISDEKAAIFNNLSFSPLYYGQWDSYKMLSHLTCCEHRFTSIPPLAAWNGRVNSHSGQQGRYYRNVAWPFCWQGVNMTRYVVNPSEGRSPRSRARNKIKHWRQRYKTSVLDCVTGIPNHSQVWFLPLGSLCLSLCLTPLRKFSEAIQYNGNSVTAGGRALI